MYSFLGTEVFYQYFDTHDYQDDASCDFCFGFMSCSEMVTYLESCSGECGYDDSYDNDSPPDVDFKERQ